MLTILLPIAFLSGLLVFRRRGLDWRSAVLSTATVWALYAVCCNEVLSLSHSLTAIHVAAAWGLFSVVALAYVWYPRSIHGRPYVSKSDEPQPEALSDLQVALLTTTAALLGLIGLNAILAAPNPTDAMVYHMPRIVHWIQDRSVAFYPASNMQQLFQPPGAEYLMLHLQLLSGGDRWVNLIACFGFTGAAIGASLAARHIGAGRSGQVLAFVVSATVPQGILQASGAKNDCAVAFWLVTLTCFLLRFRSRPSWQATLAISASLGLALLTKGTAYVFAPFIVMGCFAAWPGETRIIFLKRLWCVALIATAINAGQYVRNYQIEGSVFGCPSAHCDGKFVFRSGSMAPSLIASNIVRNVGLHLGTPSETANGIIRRAAERVIRFLGADPNDPRNTWDGTTFDVPIQYRIEDSAANSIHVALIFLLGWGFLGRAAHSMRSAVTKTGGWVLTPETGLGLGLFVGFLAFCALLKWQPWHTRLQLPLFLVSSTVIGVAIDRRWRRSTAAVVAVLLLAFATPFVLANQTRPLMFESNVFNQHRAETYAGFKTSYPLVANMIRSAGCRQIGIDITHGESEYPLLAWLGAGKDGTRVEVLHAQNLSTNFARNLPTFTLCAVVCAGCAATPAKRAEYARVGPIEVVGNDLVAIAASTASPFVLVSPDDGGTRAAQASFGPGWFGFEQDGSSWWRWLEERGEIDIMCAAPGWLELKGDLAVVGAKERAVTISVADHPEMEKQYRLAEQWFRPLTADRIRVQAGPLRIFISADGPAAAISERDRRRIRLGLRNFSWILRVD